MSGNSRQDVPIDPEKLGGLVRTVFGSLEGAMTAAMIHLGDRMGLYRALTEVDDYDSHELAAATGLSERWVREWLHQQGAAGVLEHRGDERFGLSPEGVAVLSNEHHPAFGAGFFTHLPQTMMVAERIPEAFQSGVGLPYDAFGAEGARGIERGFAPWFRTLLVPAALPRIKGVVEKLSAGGVVADVGCGTGVALVEMAKAYPDAQLHGYDISQHALDRAEANASEAGVSNVSFHDAKQEPIPQDSRFDFVTTFDCLHDMTRPAEIMKQIRGAIADDGVWLISDIKSHGSYEANVEQNPMAAMMYGTSVLTCMSSALSEVGGAGLGTLGLHGELMEQLVRDAGFSEIEALELDHPVNAFYVARP